MLEQTHHTTLQRCELESSDSCATLAGLRLESRTVQLGLNSRHAGLGLDSASG